VLEQTGMRSGRVVILTDGGGFSAQTVDLARRFAARGHRLDVVCFASAGTVEPSPPDLAAVAQTASAGGGMLIEPDADGGVDIARLDLAMTFFSRSAVSQLTLHSTEWRNMSHLLLLLALAPMLLLFRRAHR